MVYFYKLLLGWRVVSLALITHLPINIYTCSVTCVLGVLLMLILLNYDYKLLSFFKNSVRIFFKKCLLMFINLGCSLFLKVLLELIDEL